MKTKKFLFVCLIAALAAFGSVTTNAQNGAGGNSIAGGWKVRVTSADPTVPPFDELITFSDGGGLVETNNLFPNPFLNQDATPGHGSWRYEGMQRYSFAFVKLLSNLQTRQPLGTLTVRGTVALRRPNAWEGPATVTIEDPNGNILMTAQTFGTATRIMP